MIDNKVILDEDNSAITEYYLQITQRLEDARDQAVVRIVKMKSENADQATSRFTTRTWKIKIYVREMFQAIMFYYAKFTDDDIPDPLW